MLLHSCTKFKATWPGLDLVYTNTFYEPFLDRYLSGGGYGLRDNLYSSFLAHIDQLYLASFLGTALTLDEISKKPQG